MSGEEEKLYTRAEMLDETGELAQAVAGVLAGAQGAGVDPRAVISLTAALQTLDPGASTGYTAGSRKDRQDGSGYGSDGEFLEALSDAEDQVRERLREVKDFRNRLPWPWTARSRTSGRPAATWRRRARRWPPLTPWAPGSRATAATEPRPPRSQPPRPPSPRPRPGSRTRNAGSASARPPPTSSTPLAERLARALAHLRTVPQDLGEVYELIYEFVRSGGKLPRYARWIEGAGADV